MMAYAQLYRAPRLTLLYPYHPGLGAEDAVHARHRITGHATVLETASIDVASNDNILDRLRRLLIGENAVADAVGNRPGTANTARAAGGGSSP
jgi:5-methylcytosine-specific restriction enzyme subunit McrC